MTRRKHEASFIAGVEFVLHIAEAAAIVAEAKATVMGASRDEYAKNMGAKAALDELAKQVRLALTPPEAKEGET